MKNEFKQIDCQLNCKASASLAMDVACNDLEQEDRPLDQIMGKELKEDESQDNDGTSS